MVGAIDVRYRIDVESLHRDGTRRTLELNDLGRVHLQLTAPLVFDSYRRNRVTGSLIVIDEASNETVARGRDPRHRGRGRGGRRRAASERSPNVRWQGTQMTRERRWESLGHSGATVWFTGLPGAGKSTIAAAVEERLIAAGRPPSCSTATICATDSTAISASTSTRAARTYAAPGMSRGCSRSRARSRS